MLEQPFLDHRDRSLRGRGGRALGRSGLQQVEPALLDRELDVLHVAEVALEEVDGPLELLEGGGEPRLHLRQRDGQPDSGNDVLALSVDEELATQPACPRGRIAAEAHARAAVVASVPEHHLHHVDGGTEVVGDAVRLPVHLRPRRVPGLEHRPDGAEQLLARVRRELAARTLA